ncbi:OmpP1/FadL family transporter [Paracandidimonas soli]|uniref:OmpP1/FadL family transporter n=1 Tax=Paracandidimonas soli TaxID=1917182 RepID=UPI0033425CFA
MTTRSTFVLRAVPALLLGLGSAGAQAAGFQLLEQNASGIGNAYAGSAAIAENASTIYFNPAGMTLLPGLNVSGGLSLIRPSFKFSDSGSTAATRPVSGLPASPGNLNGGDAGSWAAVPNAYLSWQVNERWFLGLGIGAPFGLATEYGDDWIGRYHSKKFSIETININPSVAFKVNDRLSIGAGLNWQHIKADYRRAVPHPMPGQTDMEAKVKMSGDAWGWNLGLMYQLTDDTRVGLSYRSRIKHKPDGDLAIRNDGATIPGLLPAMQVSDANASVSLPDTAILSVVHNLNSRWTLLGDVSWTGWSSIPKLDIESNGAVADTLKLKFRDTWRVALGANYRVNDKWTIKTGIAYDQSPVDDDNLRPTSLPDNNRTWLSLGAQYRFGSNTVVDVGYTRLFTSSTGINNDSAPEKGVVRGSYKSNVNLFGIQVSHRF